MTARCAKLWSPVFIPLRFEPIIVPLALILDAVIFANICNELETIPLGNWAEPEIVPLGNWDEPEIIPLGNPT